MECKGCVQKMVKISQRLKEKMVLCLEKLNYRSKKKLFLFSQGGVKISDLSSIQEHVSTIFYLHTLFVENATKSYKIQLSTKQSAGSLYKSLKQPLNHIKSLLVI